MAVIASTSFNAKTARGVVNSGCKVGAASRIAAHSASPAASLVSAARKKL
eukprot:CAMPEP_0170321366 /NCGR_PEP_ID=MMETSP0116_2-20130129/61443_1 /TAXON_ID=400756 /ORGANISM="Durinskia baltica, Strain CSIRO CS-38" /LENGTH=49 /DNA_ID= /DNA_START= /DNA_END= /DNA_ORIENTATION=